MLQHMQLLAKYGSKKLGDLTPHDVGLFAGALGLDISQERVVELTSLLHQDSLDTVADWVGRPENLTRVQEFIAAPGSQEPVAVKCPLCAGVFELHYDK